MRRLGVLALLFACSSSGSGSVQLAPNIIIPQDLLMGVTKLTVSVYDPQSGTLSCNAMNGTVSGLTNQVPLATSDLGSSNCGTGVEFCGSISVNQTGDQRLFTAQAFVGTASSPIASGCTSQAPNQSTLQVTIKMLRTLPPQICNMMPSSELVQCPTGSNGDPVCDQNCQSLEEYFSASDNTDTSDKTQKQRPMLVWPSATGDAGRLVGVWGEINGGNQVSMRVLDQDMEPYTGQGPCIQNSSFRMPTLSGSPCPPPSYPTGQYNPTVATVGGNYYIAYEDSNTVPATGIQIRQLSTILAPSSATQVSMSSSNQQLQPSMAANGSTLFVAWQAQGSILGRTVTVPGMTLGTQQTLGMGTGVTVAATSSGWVASFLNGSDVDMVTLDNTGTPGTPVKVNSSSGVSHPGIAASGTTVAVVWANGGNIFVQRFTNGTTPVMGDQVNALEDPSLGGGQSDPSVASGSNFFVATWVDTNSGHIRARFLDTNNGYMFNQVNGQSSDFQASTLNGDTRDNPIAVVGGTTPYVSIAWEDPNTGSPEAATRHPGARRFPLPE